jgi:hypothetical protein
MPLSVTNYAPIIDAAGLMLHIWIVVGVVIATGLSMTLTGVAIITARRLQRVVCIRHLAVTTNPNLMK